MTVLLILLLSMVIGIPLIVYLETRVPAWAKLNRRFKDLLGGVLFMPIFLGLYAVISPTDFGQKWRDVTCMIILTLLFQRVWPRAPQTTSRIGAGGFTVLGVGVYVTTYIFLFITFLLVCEWVYGIGYFLPIAGAAFFTAGAATWFVFSHLRAESAADCGRYIVGTLLGGLAGFFVSIALMAYGFVASDLLGPRPLTAGLVGALLGAFGGFGFVFVWRLRRTWKFLRESRDD